MNVCMVCFHTKSTILHFCLFSKYKFCDYCSVVLISRPTLDAFCNNFLLLCNGSF